MKAVATHPCKGVKNNSSQRNFPVTFGGVTFIPGEYLYADDDGILVSENVLSL